MDLRAWMEYYVPFIIILLNALVLLFFFFTLMLGDGRSGAENGSVYLGCQFQRLFIKFLSSTSHDIS
jgi:hypothetical protein